MSPEEFLQHHGVKGMRWGVRRFQPYSKKSGKKGKFLNKRRSAKKDTKRGSKGSTMSKTVKALTTVAKTVAITAVAASTVKAGHKAVDLLADRHAGRFIRANTKNRANTINKLSKTMKRVYG